MPTASLSRWTMSYFAAALAFLIAAEALAAVGVGYPAAGLADPSTLVLVHLVAIGWLSLAVAGALLQFVPVLVSRPLAFPQLALPALLTLGTGLALLCAGFSVLAGWIEAPLDLLPLATVFLLCGFFLLGLMLVGTLLSARPIALFARFVLIGLACLAATALSGTAFAMILSGHGGWLGAVALLPDALPFHAVLGFGGWLGLIAFGVSYRLFVMFMMAPEPPPAHIRPVLTFAGLGLGLAFTGLAAPFAGVAPGSAWVAATLAVLALASAFYGRDILALYRARRRKALEINMLASIPAFAALGIGLTLLPVAVLAGAEEGWIAALALLLVFGWLGGLTLAQLVKIVSFMTWLETYAPRLGRGPAPRVGDLVAMPRTGWWFLLYYGGVALGAAMLVAGAASGFRWSMMSCLAGTAGIAVELFRVRRLSEIKAAERPMAHERPWLLLARSDERKSRHVDIGSIANPRA
ncbi:conserved membrane hypothetical protein [Hyphomicrobiales bacterium]|nr:conserved membrane hypothetical protein [Hyphomicrobiales bacterium]CAH1699119.1 conserved membrane hypothetical protein [Hyphomicrobiales bacterium]CAI0342909.1 conserved membrane hypothetical protein [Hyphomicrobiales bacterium]